MSDVSRKEPCERCGGKQYLRIEGTNMLVPCLECNAGGTLQVLERSDDDE